MEFDDVDVDLGPDLFDAPIVRLWPPEEQAVWEYYSGSKLLTIKIGTKFEHFNKALKFLYYVSGFNDAKMGQCIRSHRLTGQAAIENHALGPRKQARAMTEGELEKLEVAVCDLEA